MVPRPATTAAQPSLKLPEQTGARRMGITKTRCGMGPEGPPLRLDIQVTVRSPEVNRQGPQALAAMSFQVSVQAGE